MLQIYNRYITGIRYMLQIYNRYINRYITGIRYMLQIYNRYITGIRYYMLHEKRKRGLTINKGLYCAH